MMRNIRGLSLVELLIASALGIVVSMFIMGVMMTSARTSATAEGVSQAQETARLVMAWLQREVRRGGFQYEMDAFPAIAPACTGTVTPPNNNADCTFNMEANNQGGDRIAIRRKVYNEADAPRDGQTCAGVNIDAAIINSANNFVTDVYWVAPNLDNDNDIDDLSFRCVTYDSAGNRIGNAETIANGIQSMQVLYGIAGQPDELTRFVRSNQLSPIELSQVTAVRIAILARSFDDDTIDEANRTYELLDSTPENFEDSFARFVQVGTVWLPNTEQ